MVNLRGLRFAHLNFRSCLPKIESLRHELREFFHTFDMIQVITLPTRHSPYRGTLIDHCYVRMNYPAEQGIVNIGLSDYKLIFVTRKKNKF